MTDPDILARIITTLNPWRSPGTGKLPQVPTTERNLLAPLTARLLAATPPGKFRHEVIVGPRRSGKSTLLKQLASKLCHNQNTDPQMVIYLSLDEFHQQKFQLHQIVELIVGQTQATISNPLFLLIDEVAYAPDWDTSLKVFYDSPERYPVKIVATSSAALELNRGMLESGADRWNRTFLLPCQIAEQHKLAGAPIASSLNGESLQEILESIPQGYRTPDRNLEKLHNYMIFGGFPGHSHLYLMEDSEIAMLESYRNIRRTTAKVLSMDSAHFAPDSKPETLAALFHNLAENPCGLINPGKRADMLSIKKPTLEKYLNILEESMLAFRLDNWKGRGKKSFFYDNTIPAAATFQNRQTMLASHPGWTLENMAASAMYETARHSIFGTNLFHLRHNQQEADFIFLDHKQESPMVIEIGYSNRHSLTGLEYLIGAFPKLKGNAYLVTPKAETNHESGIRTIPLFEFLLAVEHRKDYLLANA